MDRRNLIQKAGAGIGGTALFFGGTGTSVATKPRNRSDEVSVRDLKSQWLDNHGPVDDMEIKEKGTNSYEVVLIFEDGTKKVLAYEVLSNEEYLITYRGQTINASANRRKYYQESFFRSNDEVSVSFGAPWDAPDFGDYEEDVGPSDDYFRIRELKGENTWKKGAGAPGSKNGANASKKRITSSAWSETNIAGWVRAGADIWTDIELDASRGDVVRAQFDWESYSGISVAAGAGGVVIRAMLYNLSENRMAASKDSLAIKPNKAGFGYAGNKTRSGKDEVLTTVNSSEAKYRLGFRLDTAAFSGGSSWTTCNAGWRSDKDGLNVTRIKCDTA